MRAVRLRPALVAAALLLGLGAPASADAVLAAHGISPFGDLKYPADFTHFDYVNPEAPKGGTMSFRGTAAIGTFDSLNAFILGGNAAQGLGRIYDSLLAGAADEPGAYYGLLASSLEYPADRSWVIFTLRPEARFADGSQVTAEDVAWTLETLKTKGHPFYQLTLQAVDKVEVLTPSRIKISFQPGAAMRDLAAEVGTVAILPKHYYTTHEFSKPTMEKPLGSGPYVVDRADPGRQIRYCRNENYWAADLPVNRGTNNFDCYVYEYFTDEAAAFEALATGTFLLHEEYSASNWATNYNFPALKNGWVKREEIPDARPSGTQGFWFNLRRDKFQDPRVREAIGMLFNFEWANETLFHGQYKRTDSFWENADGLQAEGLPSPEELAVLEKYRADLPQAIFTEAAYVPPIWSPRANSDRRARTEAGKLLDEAGYPVSADGLRRSASGQVLAVELVDDSPSILRILEPFAQNLRAAGIDATVSIIDRAQMEKRQDDFDFDITSARLPMNMSPSTELRPMFSSAGAAAPGTLNLAGIADPVVDALIEEIIAAPSRAEMEGIVRALDRVLRAKHVWVPNWYSGSYRLAYWDIFGRPEVQPAYDRGVDFWWFDQGKYDRLKSLGALR